MEDPDAAAAPGEATLTLKEERDEDRRAPLRRLAPSRGGLIGLGETLSADTGEVGTFRLSASFAGFGEQAGFPDPESSSRFLETKLSLAWTPLEVLEVALLTRGTSVSDELERPNPIQTQGDLLVGLKGGQFWGIFGLAGATELQLYSHPEGGGWLNEATSYSLHLLMTLDWLRMEAPVPLRMLFDFQYVWENSEALFNALPGEPSITQEWAYQSARYDRFNVRAGVEAPTEFVSPFMSYLIGTPFQVEQDRLGRGSRPISFESIPHALELGIRGFLPGRVTAELAYQIGLSDAPTTGIPATPPGLWRGALTYHLDPRPVVRERVIERTPPAPPPARRLLTGQVIDKQTRAPIAGAQVSYPAPLNLSAQLSDAEGSFGGYRLEPGNVILSVTAQGYRAKRFRVGLRAGEGPREVRLPLIADPLAQPAPVRLTFLDDEGQPVTGQLILEQGQQRIEEQLAEGRYQGNLAPGSWSLRFTEEPRAPAPAATPSTASSSTAARRRRARRRAAPPPPPAERPTPRLITQEIQVIAQRGLSLELRLPPRTPTPTAAADEERPAPSQGQPGRRRPSTRYAQVRGNRIVPREPIQFRGDGAQLTRTSARVVESIGALMTQRTHRRRSVLIEVHTHSRGDRQADETLGRDRINAIRRILLRSGVPRSRIQVRNHGGTQPIAPNFTRFGRRKNQRATVQFAR